MFNKLKVSLKQARINLQKQYLGYINEISLYFSYPLREKQVPSTKFVILGFQRTGSTLLVNLLNEHPEIQCEGELLLNRMFYPKRYIDLRSTLTNKNVYGFKLLTPHFLYQRISDPKLFMEKLYSDGYKIIKLKRRNLFRASLSLYHAVNSGKYHYKESDKSTQFDKLYVNPHQLLKTIEWIDYHSNLQDSIITELPHLEIFYEDNLIDIDAQRNTLQDILEFLNVAYVPLSSKFIKATPDEITQYVINADEITDYIKNTKYSKYLGI